MFSKDGLWSCGSLALSVPDKENTAGYKGMAADRSR